MRSSKKALFWLTSFLIGGTTVYLTFSQAIGAGRTEGWGTALSGIAAGLLAINIVPAYAIAIDYFALDNFDLINELRQGNIAVAIVFGSLLISSALAMAFAS